MAEHDWRVDVGDEVALLVDQDRQDMAGFLGKQVGVQSVVQLDREVFVVSVPMGSVPPSYGPSPPPTRASTDQVRPNSRDSTAPAERTTHGATRRPRRTHGQQRNRRLMTTACRDWSLATLAPETTESRCGSTRTAFSSSLPGRSPTGHRTPVTTHVSSVPSSPRPRRPNWPSTMRGDGFRTRTSTSSSCAVPDSFVVGGKPR